MPPATFATSICSLLQKDLVPVSSTVIPLTVLEVSYGLGGKPTDEYKAAYLRKLRKQVQQRTEANGRGTGEISEELLPAPSDADSLITGEYIIPRPNPSLTKPLLPLQSNPNRRRRPKSRPFSWMCDTIWKSSRNSNWKYNWKWKQTQSWTQPDWNTRLDARVLALALWYHGRDDDDNNHSNNKLRNLVNKKYTHMCICLYHIWYM